MKRSSRSTPTGPGSRGGRWHDPEYRRQWFRDYHRANPQYREADNERRAADRRAQRRAREEHRVTVSLTIVLREMVRRDLAKPGMTYHFLGERFGVAHTTVMRFVHEEQQPNGDFIDALVAHYGHWRISRAWTSVAKMFEERAAEQGGPSGNVLLNSTRHAPLRR